MIGESGLTSQRRVCDVSERRWGVSSKLVYNEHGEAIGFVKTDQSRPRYTPYGLFNDYSSERLETKRTWMDAVWAIREWQKT